MLIFGIISEGNYQTLYFLIRSINKHCTDYHIHIFDKNKKLYNIIDNTTKHLDIEDPYSWLINNIDSNDELVILNDHCLINNKFKSSKSSKKLGSDCYYLGFNRPHKKGWQEKIKPIKISNIVEYDFSVNYINWLYKYPSCWKFDNIDVIVGLTTWTGRINDDALYDCLDHLKTQVCKYNYKIVLCLSMEELHGKYPDRLKWYENKKFEILWTDKNTRPLKKYDPINAKYPEIPIITMDDDDICNEKTVQYMYETYLEDPWSAYGTAIESGPGYNKWIADIRIWPPHCMYQFPLEDYYTYFNGILDDNFNQMRCLFKMTPVKEAIKHSDKRNDSDKKLSYEYADTKWEELYLNFLDAHYDELPKDLMYYS